MLRMRLYLAALLQLFLAVQCSPIAQTVPKQRSGIRNIDAIPLPPSSDPWYTAPSGWQQLEPGTILRIRMAPGNLTTVIANSSTAYNILYRSTNSHYQPSWAVTTLLAPLSNTSKFVNEVSPARLLVYNVPYDTSNVDGSPTYTLYGQPPPDIGRALGQGYFVSVPDYEGPLASFTAGVNSGHGVLDSVRAVLSANVLRSDRYTNTAPRYVMWGYSGGSLATEFAAELQAQYAPELKFSGVAIGGVLPNMTRILDRITGTGYSGLIPNILIGLASQWTALKNYILQNLKPIGQYNSTTFLSAQHLSTAQSLGVFLNQDVIPVYLDVAQTTFENNHAASEAFTQDTLAGRHGIPTMPLFIYKAIHDELSPIADTDALVAQWCENDVDVLYQRNTAGNHLDEYTNGNARAWEWLTSVLDETSNFRGGCVVQNVTVNITSTAPFLGNGTGQIP